MHPYTSSVFCVLGVFVVCGKERGREGEEVIEGQSVRFFWGTFYDGCGRGVLF